jgi:ketosteroid isomerase-like protein
LSLSEPDTPTGFLRAARLSTDSLDQALEAAGLSEKAMSQENVEVVEAAFGAMARAGFDEALAYVDPEVEFAPPDEAVESPTGFKRHDALRERWATLMEPFQDARFEPVEFIDVDDKTVVAVFRLMVRGRASEVPVEAEPAYVLTLRDGKITRMRAYLHKDQALEAVSE